jgi:hypothetical protein
LEAVAGELHRGVTRIHSARDADSETLSADWAVVSELLEAKPPQRAVRPWTDDFSNLFQAWR